MLEAYLAVVLLLLLVLFLAHHKWESSSRVQTIDLIPGPKRKLIVGNATSLPRESDGIVKITISVTTILYWVCRIN